MKYTLFLGLCIEFILSNLWAQCNQSLPAKPNNFLEKLSYNEQINETNSVLSDGKRPESIMDKGALMYKSEKSNVECYLSFDGKFMMYQHYLENSEWKSYFQKIVSTYSDDTKICHYDASGRLISSLIKNQTNQEENKTESLLSSPLEINPEFINLIHSEGGLIKELSSGVWQIKIDKFSTIYNLKDQYILHAVKERGEIQNLEKEQLYNVFGNETYPDVLLHCTTHTLQTGKTFKRCVETTRSKFEFIRNSGQEKKLDQRTQFESENFLALSPNPANSELWIKTNILVEKLNIYNLNMNLVKSITSVNTPAVNVAFLAKGIYFLEVTGKQGTKISKFIKN